MFAIGLEAIGQEHKIPEPSEALLLQAEISRLKTEVRMQAYRALDALQRAERGEEVPEWLRQRIYAAAGKEPPELVAASACAPLAGAPGE